ncbi:MAG: hypothetical protein Q9213_005159 [Squamulea squamosa]
MGGFLAPDPTNGFTNCMHAFAFIRPARKVSERNPKPKRETQHQGSSQVDTHVKAPRPLPPAPTSLGIVSIAPDQESSLKTAPLIRPSRGRRRLCKKRVIRETSKSTLLPVATRRSVVPVLDRTLTSPPPLPPRPHPEVKIEPRQYNELDNAPSAAVPVALAPNANPFDDKHSISTGGVTIEDTAELRGTLSTLRPCLPHQRMHYLRRLGSGGEGHIDLFRLYCPPQSLLAVKTLKCTPELIWHKNNKRKPLEAHILQDLLPNPHPHIVQMFGYTYTPRKTMFFYEYCSLGDLQDVVENYFYRSVAIPEGFIWHVYLAIAKALAYLHTGYSAQSLPDSSTRTTDIRTLQIESSKPWTPILHRDIKPENIFFRPSVSSPYPTPLLADFGLATPHTPEADECSGTFMYQGPEIPLQTPASDLWSLGATIHALVHGRPPMVSRPEGRSREDWEWDPRSRRVKEVGQRGYSLHLGVIMRGVLRKRMEDRVGGKRLIDFIEAGSKAWGGEEVVMEEWAFKKPEGEQDNLVEKEGGVKPWRRG